MHRVTIIALALAGSGGSALWAQDVMPVYAVGGTLSEALTRAVAKYALPSQTRLGLETDASTSAQLIAERCGAMLPGYFDEFKALNKALLDQAGKSTLTPDDPVGSVSQKLSWPACLIVLQPGATAKRSVTVELQPNAGVSMDELVKQVDDNIAENAKGEDEASWSPPRPMLKGVLISSVDDDAGQPKCPAVITQPPFDPQQVAAFYRLSLERSKALNRPRGDVTVVVFDNGFYGYNPGSGTPYSMNFPQAYFRDWEGEDGTIGPVVNIGGKIYPWIDPAVVPVTSISSHGTHVAGLVLGGPDFSSYRDIFNKPDNSGSWIHLGIVNLAKGGRTLIDGSSGILNSVLSRVPGQKEGRVINMSLAYYESDEDVIGSDFRALVSNHAGDLFIVAAGNEGDDVGHLRAFPAMLGGQRSNVITVGAHDDNQPSQLAAFSNRGSNVDIAAPGCRVQSWADMTPAIKPLTGTSQAASLVSFDAILLRSLDQAMLPGDVKKRILAAADVYDIDPGPTISPRYKINIAKSLLLFDDFVRLKSGDTYIGHVDNVRALRCASDSAGARFGRDLKEILAYKASVRTLMLVDGDPCSAAIDPPNQSMKPRVKMIIRYRLEGVEAKLPSRPAEVFALEDVAELVMHAPPAGHYQ